MGQNKFFVCWNQLLSLVRTPRASHLSLEVHIWCFKGEWRLPALLVWVGLPRGRDSLRPPLAGSAAHGGLSPASSLPLPVGGGEQAEGLLLGGAGQGVWALTLTLRHRPSHLLTLASYSSVGSKFGQRRRLLFIGIPQAPRFRRCFSFFPSEQAEVAMGPESLLSPPPWYWTRRLIYQEDPEGRIATALFQHLVNSPRTFRERFSLCVVTV